MTGNNEHYRKVVDAKKGTRFVRCGYDDRFDPFTLNKSPVLRAMYDELFRSFLGRLTGGRILDVGCGTGIYFDALAPYAREVEAVDSSAEMVEVARTYCERSGLSHIHPRVGAAEALDFAEASFDVVIEMDVLHHVGDFGGVMEEVHRVLKPGGHFLAFEPNICNPLMFVAHVLPREERKALRRNRPGRLRELLAEHFDEVRWEGVAGLVTQTRGWKRAFLDAYTRGCQQLGIPSLYPRQAWLGVKR